MSNQNNELHKEDAANKYAAMVVYMMKRSDKVFSPAITRSVMNFIEAYESDCQDQDTVWACYADLIDTARLEGEKIDMAPLMALKLMNNIMEQ